MAQYLLKTLLQRKESEIHFDACQIDHVHELSDQEFRAFQHTLLTDHDFLREYNANFAGEPVEGLRSGVLVLGKGYDDGIFACTEGYDYARYSAYVPNARQALLMKQYPTLQAYGKDMAELADRCIRKAVTLGLPEEYRFTLYDVHRHSNSYYAFNGNLFMDMLCDRSEIDSLEVDGDEVILTINPDYLPQKNQGLRSISAEDFKVACAKHLLWSYGAGGEQADFSNCVFDRVNFSGMELNSAIFDGAQFRSCNLSNASLCFASFKGCTFVRCDCHGWTAEEGIFQEAVFDHCNLNGAVMTHSDFSNAVLQDCGMEHASIRNSLTENMRLEDVGIGTLNLDGTTEDAAQWFHDATPGLSMEELK